MGQLTDTQTLNHQYGTADKLNTRISIHAKYSVNKQGFGNWITEHYRFPEHASVLELGCGTGDMWKDKSEIIARCGRLILSDFSAGMLEQAKETLKNESGIEYRVIDIQEIPCPDQDLAKGLSEVRRVLKDGGLFCCATYGENGMMEYIGSLFSGYGIETRVNANFTLQNGAEKLSPYFTEIKRDLYEDALLVTDVEDLVDYIFSLTGMTDLRKLPRETVREVLSRHMVDGVLRIPKEYGMFIARK